MKMTREYIVKEGLLETYFLGELPADQEQQVFEVLQSDPELKKEYEALERSMEKLASENAVTPPSNVKEDLLKQISKKDDETKPIRRILSRRDFTIAAGIAALFMIGMFVSWFQMNQAQTNLESKISEQERLLDSLNSITQKLLEKDNLIAFMNDPKTERHLLLGNQLASEAAVLSYINHEQQSVLINLQNLPELADKDYQMWADVDGEMIDMGVIDASKQILTMNYIKDAESINITIEEKGGSDHPDVSQLIGSVSL